MYIGKTNDEALFNHNKEMHCKYYNNILVYLIITLGATNKNTKGQLRNSIN